MRVLLISFILIFVSGCAVASLAGTAVNTAVKIVEVPIKVVGAVVSSEDDDSDDENKDVGAVVSRWCSNQLRSLD